MGQVVQDEAGNLFYDQGGGTLEPINEEQALALHENPGAAANMFEATGQGIENLITAAGSLLSDSDYWDKVNKAGRERSEGLEAGQPVLAPIGRYLPQAAAGFAGRGIAGTAALEAGMGALTTPETPVQGAVVGGLAGAAGAALPGAVGYAGRKGREAFDAVRGRLQGGASLADDAMPPGVLRPEAMGLDDAPLPAAGEAPPLTPDAATATPTEAAFPPSRNPPGAAPTPGPSMAVRQAGAIEREAAEVQQAGAQRVMGDLMTPDELARYGVDLNPGQHAALTATNRSPNESALARRMMADEEARRSSPILGARINQVMDGQKAAGTNFINDQFGVDQGLALTDGTISSRMSVIGQRFDALAEEMGGVPVTKQMRDEVAEVMRLSVGRHKKVLQQAVDDALQRADNKGGVLTGEDWMKMRSELQTQMNKGMKGNIDWVTEAGEIMDIFSNALEKKLPAAAQAELRKLRKQYAIGATLAKPGVRDPDGLVNPRSFYGNWKRPQSLKQRGHDDVGRFMNTVDFLTSKRIPDSGTATRYLMNAEKLIKSAPVGGGLTAGGILGIGG